MDDIKDRLGNYKYSFFKNLQNYLNTELIFYGSIKRYDFFPKSSDVDIAIITDNVTSLMSKLKNFLHIKNYDVKKIFQKFTEKSSEIITGYKIKYKDETNNLIFDILIYDEKYRHVITQNLNDINNLPFFMIVLLCILKFFYYNLCLIPTSIFLYIKNSLFYMYFNKSINIYSKNKATTIIIDNFI